MKAKITKQEVLNICIQQQEKQVEDLDGRVTSMKSDINNKDHSDSQNEDRQAGNVELLMIYERDLALSQTDLNYLKSFSPDEKYETVQPGTLVITNEMIFLIAISTEKFEIDGQTVVGISLRAPIYSAMEGLVKGDSFKFNESEYMIEDLC